jgi:hypothetical protein
MARSYAKLLTSIWRDTDFLRLTSAAQRTYMLLLSQPDLSPVGVLTVAERRLADLAPDTTPAQVRKALTALQAASFVVLDDGTSEVWVRSFLHHDGVLTSPNVLKAAARSFTAVHSATIREHILEQIPEGLREGFLEGFRELSPKALGVLLREPSHDLSLNLIPHPATPSETVDDDEDGIWSRWALKRLATQRQSGIAVAAPERWLAATRANLWGHYENAVAAARAADPDAGDHEIIARLEGITEQIHRDPCDVCADRGVVELFDGTCAPCTCMAVGDV